jgi:sugar/nucleoside kinase (ribokinase family)
MTMQKKHDVLTICNALMDILVDANNTEVQQLNLHKGHMHLIDQKKRNDLLNFFANRKSTVELGGSSMNAVRALALLKKKTVFVGTVSNDEYGDQIKRKMNNLGIKSLLHNAEKEATGVCLILVTPDGERTMNTYLGASCLTTIDAVPVKEIAESKIVHISGYQWVGTPEQRETMDEAIKQAEANNCLLSFDVADPWVVSSCKDTFAKVIEKHADVVFANREEAQLLYGLGPEETAEKIAGYGAIAVIKLGAQGALIQKGKEKYLVPAEPTQVVDTTAAGDMFAGGFLYGMTLNLPLPSCGKIASLLASDVISRYGAHLSDTVIAKVLKDFH